MILIIFYHSPTHSLQAQMEKPQLLMESSIKIPIKGNCNEAEDLTRQPDFSLHEFIILLTKPHHFV